MATVDLLEYLRSRTQLPKRSDHFKMQQEISYENKFEIQAEIVKSNRSSLLKRSLALATTIHPQFATTTLEELAVEVVGIELALKVVQTVHGNVHVMVNPNYSYSTKTMVTNAQRFHLICQTIDPNFDSSRLVTKVPAIWEGMKLRSS